MEINKRKANKGLDDEHQRPDGNQIQRPYMRLAQDQEQLRIMTDYLLEEDGT